MMSYFVLSFFHFSIEMSGMRSGTELCQFLRISLPVRLKILNTPYIYTYLIERKPKICNFGGYHGQ